MRIGGKRHWGERVAASVKNLGVGMYGCGCKWRWGGDGRVSATLGGKRYYGDKDALIWKWCGVSGTRTECET